jgi:hypothetical protein
MKSGKMTSNRPNPCPTLRCMSMICILCLACFGLSGATYATATGELVEGDIAFTTEASVFVETAQRQVTRVKKNGLTAESASAVTAWEASHRQNSLLATKFDAKPAPTKIKTPVRDETLEDVSAIVMLAVLIDEEGRVDNAYIKATSDVRFNDPSIEAMQAWEFSPLQKESEPTRGLLFVPLHY